MQLAQLADESVTVDILVLCQGFPILQCGFTCVTHFHQDFGPLFLHFRIVVQLHNGIDCVKCLCVLPGQLVIAGYTVQIENLDDLIVQIVDIRFGGIDMFECFRGIFLADVKAGIKGFSQSEAAVIRKGGVRSVFIVSDIGDKCRQFFEVLMYGIEAV